MSDAVWVALATVILNGAVTYGVVSTRLEWLRRDVDSILSRLQHLEREA